MSRAARLMLSAVLALIAAVPARAGTLSEESRLLRTVAIEQKPGAVVPPELTFRDESGRMVRLGDYFGERPVILHLVYLECPMLCNVTSDSLVRTLKVMNFSAGEEFTVLTVSFDPRETPRLAAAAKRTAMKRYDRTGSDGGWHFLTGDETNIRRLTDAVGFHYAWNERLGQYAHGAGLIILTPEGKVSRYLGGIEYRARDLRLALVEASDNQIGSVVDQALLLCYPYDPHTGQYGWAINVILQVAGISTVGLLAGSVLLMLRRERARQRTQADTPTGRGPWASLESNHDGHDAPRHE